MKVTDNNGAFGRDTVQVTITVIPNIPPLANAGPDHTLSLPNNYTSLTGSGSDADGSIVGYNWRQISGPSNNVLFSVNTAVTYVNNLIEGTYKFELSVTDNKGATARDSVNVILIGTPGTQIQLNNAKIYPNPMVDNATLEITTSNFNAKLNVDITDIQGKNVYRKELTSVQQNVSEKIDLRNLNKGEYLVTVYFDNGERKTIKVIKQ
jgi:Secretion system C-terminal sorting domain